MDKLYHAVLDKKEQLNICFRSHEYSVGRALVCRQVSTPSDANGMIMALKQGNKNW
jgi:hypothetical protein